MGKATTHPDIAPRLKKEWSCTSSSHLDLHGLLQSEIFDTVTKREVTLNMLLNNEKNTVTGAIGVLVQYVLSYTVCGALHCQLQ
jgi:hypothetical protein